MKWLLANGAQISIKNAKGKTVRALVQDKVIAKYALFQDVKESIKVSGLKWTKIDTPPASGLKWRANASESKPQGQELSDRALVEALTGKKESTQQEFSKQEWDDLGVINVSMDDFVRLGDCIYRPVEPKEGRDLGKQYPKLAEELEKVEKEEVEKEKVFKQQEWDGLNIQDLRFDDYVKSGGSYFKPAVTIVPIVGLKWKNMGASKPQKGRDLSKDYPKLATALKDKESFTHQEWEEFEKEAFGMRHDLRHDDFVKSGDSYFKQALPTTTPRGQEVVAGAGGQQPGAQGASDGSPDEIAAASIKKRREEKTEERSRTLVDNLMINLILLEPFERAGTDKVALENCRQRYEAADRWHYEL